MARTQGLGAGPGFGSPPSVGPWRWILRTIQSFYGTYNVKYYGAKGDGTTDDTAAEQAALDACETAGGGTVWHPLGTYICSGLRIGSNTHLTGAKGAVLKLKDNASSIGTTLFPDDHHLILSNKNAKSTGVTNIEISGLTFDANTANNHVDEWTHAMEFWGIVGANIHDCVGQNIRGEFVVLAHNTGTTHNADVQIHDIRLSNVGKVYAGEPGGAGHAKRQGIAVEDGENITIDNIVGRDIGAYLVDLEPFRSPQVCKAVTVSNLIGKECGTGIFSAVGVAAAHVTDVTASNLVLNNTTYSEYIIRFGYCDHFSVAGIMNPQPCNFEGVLIQNSNFGVIDRLYTEAPSNSAANTYSAIKITDSTEIGIRSPTIKSGATNYKWAIEESGSTFNTTIDATHRIDAGATGTISVGGSSATVRHIPRSTPSKASASDAPVLVLPVESDVITVTGTSNITSIYSVGSWPNRRVTLIFTGILTFTDGSNLKLAGNFVTSADDTITLVFDGTNWYEQSRSAN